MTDDELAAIKARVEAATPGPWKWELSPANYDIGYMKGGDGSNMCLFPAIKKIRNGRLIMMETADFIAHSRTDIPALLAHVEAQAERIKGLEMRVQKESEERRLRV